MAEDRQQHCESPCKLSAAQLYMWQQSIRAALELARESESDIDPVVWHYLESEACYLWQRLQQEPNEYIMLKDEFALFNFFIYRFEHAELAENAVARFWQSYAGPSPEDHMDSPILLAS